MAIATTETIVHLTLSKKEALMLKQIVQNPLYDTKPEEEELSMKQWREAIWKALPELDELY